LGEKGLKTGRQMKRAFGTETLGEKFGNRRPQSRGTQLIVGTGNCGSQKPKRQGRSFERRETYLKGEEGLKIGGQSPKSETPGRSRAQKNGLKVPLL